MCRHLAVVHYISGHLIQYQMTQHQPAEDCKINSIYAKKKCRTKAVVVTSNTSARTSLISCSAFAYLLRSA
jgi:hypothetical protein